MADGLKYKSFDEVIRNTPELHSMKINDALKLYDIVSKDIKETDERAIAYHNMMKYNSTKSGSDVRQLTSSNGDFAGEHPELENWYNEIKMSSK